MEPWRKAAAQLAAADPVMASLIVRLDGNPLARRHRRRPKLDAYGTLVASVIGQQLSTRAAATIQGRVWELFGGEVPDPGALLATDPGALRACGLSGRKVEYLHDLARHVSSGELELDRLSELDDEEVIAEITAVRGFGRWSAEMFLIFFCERPDVLPVGDLGIRRAVQVAYEVPELPDPEELITIAAPWRPHRTLACLYLWESLHSEPEL